MPPLNDPEIRKKILDALSSTEHGDGVKWTRPALANLHKDLPRLAHEKVNQILRKWVEKGNRINICVENRLEWKDKYTHHYDFTISIGGRKRYIECRLIDDATNSSELFVVSFHDP